MEALICKFSRLLSRDGIDSRALVILFCNLQNPGYRLLELLMHRPIKDWVSDIVAQIERTNEEDIDSWNLCNSIELAALSILVLQ